MKRNLRIAFVTERDIRPVKNFGDDSVISKVISLPNMAKALEKYCGEVEYLCPLTRKPPSILEGCYESISRRVFKKRYNYARTPLASKFLARQIREKMKGKKYDVIFAAQSDTEIAFLETSVPIVYTSDATFAAMVGYYPGFDRLVSRSLRDGHLIESRALDKVRAILYPSEWAKKSATEDYHIAEHKIFVIPYGANLQNVPQREDVICRKFKDEIVLLFLGLEWERKGGPIALDAHRKLREWGIRSRLVICGCTPPHGVEKQEGVESLGFLNMSDPKDYKKREDILMNAHFLLVPSRAEPFGIVFCEAAAYGIPSIATATGGVPSVVQHEITGFTLHNNAGPESYAKVIRLLYEDQNRYWKMRQAARDRYERLLNWDMWGIQVAKVIEKVL